MVCDHSCNHSLLIITNFSANCVIGLFQADNKGETGLMGYPGPRVSMVTFSIVFFLTLSFLHVLHCYFCLDACCRAKVVQMDIQEERFGDSILFSHGRKLKNFMFWLVVKTPFQGEPGDPGQKGKHGPKVREQQQWRNGSRFYLTGQITSIISKSQNELHIR